MLACKTNDINLNKIDRNLIGRSNQGIREGEKGKQNKTNYNDRQGNSQKKI